MTRKTAAKADGAAANAPWTLLSPDQAAAATACASEMFRGFESMRRIQEKAAHEAAQRHADAAERLRSPCTPAKIAAIQSELLRFDFETATRYWQELGAAAMEMQTRMLACCTQAAPSDWMLEAVHALDGRGEAAR